MGAIVINSLYYEDVISHIDLFVPTAFDFWQQAIDIYNAI